jgi:uncharacterized membrane protein
MTDLARSKFIAGLLGPFFLVFGVSMIVNRDMFPELVHQIQNDYGLIIVAGVAALTAGLGIVTTHNIWSGWPAAITVFGWLLVIGGVLRIVFPRQLAEFAATQLAPLPTFVAVAGALMLLIGLALTYKSHA